MEISGISRPQPQYSFTPPPSRDSIETQGSPEVQAEMKINAIQNAAEGDAAKAASDAVGTSTHLNYIDSMKLPAEFVMNMWSRNNK